MTFDVEANRRKALEILERIENDPMALAMIERGKAEIAAGYYYVFDIERGWHSDLSAPVDGCECLACRAMRGEDIPPCP